MALFESLLRACNMAASIVIVLLTALIGADVLGRVLFSAPVTGVPEIVKLSIVMIVWLQFGFALNNNMHLRSNLIFARLPRGLRRLIYFANCIFGIAVFGMIAWFASDNALDTFRSGTFEGERPMRIPVWPVWSIVMLGAALMTIEYLRQGLAALAGWRSPVIDEFETDAGERS